jgi:ABC-type dipeptide/oligopeptide/nickel transport system permease subunit
MTFFHAMFGRRESAAPLISSRSVLRRLLMHRSARVGIFLAGLLSVLTLIVPVIFSDRSDRISLDQKLVAPSIKHPLGTDQYGRDQLARIADGGRRSLGSALLVLSSTLLLSLFVGVTVGMIGGIVDTLVMRIIDVWLALPSLVLALAVVGVLGVGFENLMLALLLSSWAYYARLARSYVQLARERHDVIVARLSGISWARIITGHIAPGVVTQLAVVATLDLGGIIIGIAGLSFLGLGVQPPDAEWGAMLAESRLFFTTAPWLLLAPACAIFLAVMSANLIGNALRDAADFGHKNMT